MSHLFLGLQKMPLIPVRISRRIDFLGIAYEDCKILHGEFKERDALLDFVFIHQLARALDIVAFLEITSSAKEVTVITEPERYKCNVRKIYNHPSDPVVK
ncbi:hypothetical protein MUK42_31554 [Musa troglodytarum]|uniref:Uncharacterized protein n=1 Tax=Musa troglodytarum TaxID=320322 RepID=A0A9E7KKV1_9LILI|nr:hypothetical protein MUK42_31554 [Musa troglodytarum]